MSGPHDEGRTSAVLGKRDLRMMIRCDIGDTPSGINDTSQ